GRPARYRSYVSRSRSAAGIGTAGVDRAVLEARDRRVDLRLDVGGDQALEVVERREAHAVGRDVERHGATLGAAVGDASDCIGDGLGQLLLGAGDGALR